MDSGYRAQALKILPHICARCAREFEGRRLRELTVHHKDGNHDNNPPDGSNWELLCIYCHENEHARVEDAKWESKSKSGSEPRTKSGSEPKTKSGSEPRTYGRGASQNRGSDPIATHRPLAGLDELIRKRKK